MAIYFTSAQCKYFAINNLLYPRPFRHVCDGEYESQCGVYADAAGVWANVQMNVFAHSHVHKFYLLHCINIYAIHTRKMRKAGCQQHNQHQRHRQPSPNAVIGTRQPQASKSQTAAKLRNFKLKLNQLPQKPRNFKLLLNQLLSHCQIIEPSGN